MRHLPLRELGYAIGFLVVLSASYVVAYCALVDRTELGVECILGGQFVLVRYRFGGSSAESFFAPMHKLDRRLRPECWKNEVFLHGP
jgi:hypothetical protein